MTLPDNRTYEYNIHSLSERHSSLVSTIKKTRIMSNILFLKSRSGLPVPVLTTDNGQFAFHSRFDPVREGERYLKGIDYGGFLIIFGLGAGYHIFPFIEKNDFFKIVIVEKNIGVVRTVLARVPLQSVFNDSRVSLLVDENPRTLQHFLVNQYLPSLAGKLQTIALQGRVASERDYFRSMASGVREALRVIAADFSTQAAFGKRWFTNTISNLPRAQFSRSLPVGVEKALITGAGPSLEGQINVIRKNKEKYLLIATDTSLPALLTSGIQPDLVISIDCQWLSHYHFMSGFPSDIPLILDLSSPPALARLASRVTFFTGGHPFSRFINKKWRSFPRIDTSGGNVAHAALSLAVSLKPEEIMICGVDFSYPGGKLYSRGTYLFPYFRSRENRLETSETLFFNLLFSGGTTKEKRGDTYRYVTEKLLAYRQRMITSMKNMSPRIIPLSGQGLSLPHKELSTAMAPEQEMYYPESMDWRMFLRSYVDGLIALPSPRLLIGRYWADLSEDDRLLWMTQLPAAAAIGSKPESRGNSPSATLEMTRNWTVDTTEKYLTATS